MTLSLRLYAAFFACSLMLGSWYPRIADVQSAAGLEGWQLGQSLSGYPVGILLMFTFGTRLAARLSFTRSFCLVVPALGLVLVLATLSRTVPQLFCSLVAVGALQGILAITGNVEADRMETLLERQVLVRAHGFYSLGTVLAGAMGIAFRTWAIEPWLHLTLVLPLATGLTCLATWGIETLPAGNDETAEKPGKVVRPTLPVVLLFLAGGASLYLDNAGSDWSVILLRDGYDAGVAMATMAVAIWALGQTVGRLAYPLVAGILDSTRLAIFMVCLAAIGLGSVVLASHFALAMAGLMLMGLGTSALFPMAISAAARLADRASAANVASLSQLAFLMGIATPIALGALVQVAGIRVAFASGILVLASSLVVLVLHRPFEVAGDQRAEAVT